MLSKIFLLIYKINLFNEASEGLTHPAYSPTTMSA